MYYLSTLYNNLFFGTNAGMKSDLCPISTPSLFCKNCVTFSGLIYRNRIHIAMYFPRVEIPLG